MSMDREELFQAINNLPNEQLKLVSDYVEMMTKKKGLNMEALSYITENYDKTMKDLVSR